MNIVVLLGRLTRNPDVKENYTRFTLAVDRRFSKEKATDFISCVCFGKTAKFVGEHFEKGSQMALEGRIQTGSYKDQNGNTVYTTDVVVDNVFFAGSKPSSEPSSNDGFVQVSLDDEGLPFN